MKTLFGLFLFLCGLALPTQALPSYGSPGSVAAQDATGTVWTLPTNGGKYGQIDHWQAGAWADKPVPGAEGLRLWALARGDDGAVYAFWQDPNPGQNQTPQCLVTVHRGVSSRVLARFSGVVAQDQGYYCVPTIFAGAAGDVWIAGSQPLLWHISADGAVKTFPLTPDQFSNGKLPNGPPPGLASLVDGAGRRWFWQNPQYIINADTLRGFLIWDGKTLDYHPALPGLPEQPYSAAAPLDATHFWLALTFFGHPDPSSPNSGLYRVDTRTLSAVPEMPPLHDAFDRILAVFQAGSETYVKTQDRRSLKLLFWRRRAGQWQPCLSGLDGNNWGTLNPWLSEPSGLWLGVSGGAWWLPRDAKPPVLVNWRRGLAAQDVTGLFPLPDGRILASGSQGTAPMPPTPQPLRPLPLGVTDGGISAPENLESLLAGSHGHLWGIRSHYKADAPLALAEWDGTRWRLHVPPDSVASPYALYACDSLGRVWLNTSVWHPPAQPQPVQGYVVYDPARDTWTNYKAVPDALQAAAALPGMAFLGPFLSRGAPTYLPAFSGDGRVTYADNSAGNARGMKVILYDGASWRQWQTSDISPGDSYGDYGQIPHFRHDGPLEIVLNHQAWEWTPKDGWQRGTGSPPVSAGPMMPSGGPPGLSGLPLFDSSGAGWFTWQNAVYTTRDGLWVKQPELSSFGSPFHQGVTMEDVLRDPAGRLFFVTRPGNHFDLIVWSPPPVPAPKLSVVPTSEDSVTARFGTKLAGTHWFLWRLNGGVWSAPTTKDTLALTAMARGNYRLEVKALDRHLQTSAPAADVFRIQVAPETQIARWVRALLSGTDNEREAAVAGLVKQPEAARAALQAARPGASESGRWWIDAALQQIEEQITEQITEQSQAGTSGEH